MICFVVLILLHTGNQLHRLPGTVPGCLARRPPAKRRSATGRSSTRTLSYKHLQLQRPSATPDFQRQRSSRYKDFQLQSLPPIQRSRNIDTWTVLTLNCFTHIFKTNNSYSFTVSFGVSYIAVIWFGLICWTSPSLVKFFFNSILIEVNLSPYLKFKFK